MYRYRCYGLDLESEVALALPEFQGPWLDASSQVTIDLGGLPADTATRPLTQTFPEASWGFEPEGLLVRWGTRSRFLVTPSSVRVEGDHSPAGLADVALRAALGFVLQLRGAFVVHGSAVQGPDGTLVVVGDKGAGKSTTSLGLVQRGWLPVADDMVVIDSQGVVHPGPTRTRLTTEAFGHLAGPYGLPEATPDTDGKIPFQPSRVGSPAPLVQVFVLRAGPVAAVEHRKLTGVAKARTILDHVHSPPGIGDPDLRFQRTLAVLNGVPAVELVRPTDRFAHAELLDCLEAHARRRT